MEPDHRPGEGEPPEPGPCPGHAGAGDEGFVGEVVRGDRLLPGEAVGCGHEEYPGLVVEDKKVVITGGSSGLGLATARLLVDEGARVLITGRARDTLDAARDQLGENAIAVRSYAASLPDIEAPADRVKADFGTVDALFANATHDHRADRRDLPDRADPRRRDPASRPPRPRQDSDHAVIPVSAAFQNSVRKSINSLIGR